MSSADAATADGAIAVEPSPLSAAVRWKIFAYVGALLVLQGFGSPANGVVVVPISFMLKNKFHLTAHGLALFGLAAGAPVYVSFLFGLARDTWNPLGMRDRGFFVLFGSITAAVYAAFAFAPVTLETLLVASVALGASFLFVSAALNGLIATIGQQHVMSGQVSTLWNIVGGAPPLAALVLGARLSGMLERGGAERSAHLLFMVGAAIMAGVALYGFWRPAAVFDNIQVERRAGGHLGDDVKRLVRHWPIYPALLIFALSNFAPGSGTALLYYLQNTLHASDAQWGDWNGIYQISFLPTLALYGVLCRRLSLRTLLFWGTLVTIPQMTPLLLSHSMRVALWAAIPMGLTGGMSTAAYLDLLIRACPAGLQGALLMLAASLAAIVAQLADVLGADLYDRFGGFGVCVVAITIAYALILPVLWLVPRRPTDTADGQRPAEPFTAE